jgi:alpha 1,2-mannosyltransferase
MGNKFTPYVLMTAGIILVMLSIQTFFTISRVDVRSSSSITTTKVHPDAPVKACFVVLVRNSELDGIAHTIEQIESTFNNKFHYPYVFLNDDEFTEEFKQKTSSLTTSETKYGKVDNQMWGYPNYINQTLAAECRNEMAKLNIPYADSESYRHMCR